MKGKLVELDEPVDDLMEVSKVQTQILNLTGNQVDIFDSKTKEFRSTYDILKDISAIWDDLSSTSRSSLLEILGGKQRSNVVSALIQAFQSGQVEEAYKDAMNAAGTATTEYTRMMEGVQSHLDAFKGIFEEFSNTFLESEFIKSVVDFGTHVLKFLNAVTKALGSLPTVLLPVITIMSKKSGFNIISVFQGIISSLKKTTVAATSAAASTSALAGAEAETTVNAAAMASAQNENAIATFDLAAANGANTASQTANAAAANADAAAQRNLSGAMLGTATAAKTLAASFITGLALTVAIAGLAKLIDMLVTTKEEIKELQAQEANELQDSADRAKQYADEAKSLHELISDYNSIASSTSDLSSRKSDLKNIQEQLVKTYGSEADGIDLVNGSYAEQIELLDKLDKKKAQEYVDNNRGAYEEAKNNLGVGYYTIGKTFSKKFARELRELADENDIYGYNNIGQFEGTYAQRIKAYQELRDIYAETEGHTAENLKLMDEELERMKGIYNNAKSTVIEYERMQAILTQYEETLKANNGVSILSDQDRKDLDELQKVYGILSSDDTDFSAYAEAYDKMVALQHKLADVSKSNYLVKESAASLAESYQKNFSALPDSLSELIEKFDTSLEETFKNSADIITEVQDAMENLSEGKGISHANAWKLLKADTEGYLQTIKLVNGEYVFSEEELIKLKDSTIESTKEGMLADIERANENIKQTEAVIKREEDYLRLLKAELEVKALTGQINSEADARRYLDIIESTEFAISESNKDLEEYRKLIARNNLLIAELDQNLGNTNTAADATLQSLNDTVDALEAEVDAIEDTVDALNARKDALESEKDILQDQLDLLKEQEKELKNQMDTFKKAVSDYSKRYEETLKTELDHIKEQKDEIKDQYDERINALKRENEERDTAYKKEKAILDLNKAKEQQVRTYSSARGWEYGADKEKVLEAQKNLDDVLLDEQIQNLENERDDIIKTYEDQEKEQDKRLKSFQEYAKKYDEAAEVIENADAEILAEQILGANWRVEMESQDEGLLNNYKNAYQDFTNRLDDLTNRQIKAAEESVKAKQAEIDKIDDEIKAYNNYKNTVKSNLDEAKKAVENYKSTVDQASTDVSKSLETMEGNTWDRANKVVDDYNRMANAAESAKDRINNALDEIGNASERLKKRLAESATGYGIINSAGDARLLEGYSSGGIADFTGKAMLHGTRNKPEIVLNNADSKKLYDMIHNTPNIMASMVKQATQLAGFNPSNVSNNTANSINVNIGQIVANNPQELTRNLDTHLDSYFRRKLTQGYTQ